MKKTIAKTLRLETNTVRTLSSADLRSSAGGTVGTFNGCSGNSCWIGCATFGCPPATGACVTSGGGSGGPSIGGHNLQ